MKRKKRFFTAAALTAILFTGAACGGSASPPAPADTQQSPATSDSGQATADNAQSAAPAAESPADVKALPMRYYMPGAPSTQADMVNEEINKRLAADGVPVIFQPKYIPWDQWVDKINVMISTGEEFEMFHIMSDYIPISNYAARGALTPLDDLINKYTPGMWDLYDKVLWECATVGGQVMSVPAFWRDNSGDTEGAITVRKDKFDKYGLALPDNTVEMVDTLTVLQQKWAEEDGQKRYLWEHNISGRPPTPFHRTYDTWPFYTTSDGIFMVRQDGSAELFFASEEFKKDANTMHELYKRGLIHPDILNFPLDKKRELADNGDVLFGLTPIANADALAKRGIEGANVINYWMADSKPFLMSFPLMNSNGIPSTAKHPELGLLFLDWMYSKRENSELVMYGIPGVHWKPVGDEELEVMLDADAKPLYAFDRWMIEHTKFHRFDVSIPKINGELMAESGLTRADWKGNVRESQTVRSPVIGFNFDSSTVNVELSNVMAEYTASILPIKLGVVSYEEGFENAMQQMRAAGCDKLLSEYQRQLAEFIASKKK